MISRLSLFRTNSNVISSTDEFVCPICLEIYEKPVSVTCGHAFCGACLSQCKGSEPKCPLCRSFYDPSKTCKAKELERSIATLKTACTTCKKVFLLSKLRAHHASCCSSPEGAAKTLPKAAVSEEALAAAPPTPPPAETPNRHTFMCPYCELPNFDIDGLRDHCNNMHYDSLESVICPVCASMPWGNPNQKSISFLSHLNLRHRFEYHNYVDFNISDEAALQAALEASLKEK